MRAGDISTSQDTAALWTALLEAKERDDTELVRAIEQRMRELSTERRYAHLTDEELRRTIDAATGNREPKGMIAHSPTSGMWEGGVQGAHTSRHNAAIRANQQVGVEVTLSALQAEWDRRHPKSAT